MKPKSKTHKKEWKKKQNGDWEKLPYKMDAEKERNELVWIKSFKIKIHFQLAWEFIRSICNNLSSEGLLKT